MTTNASHHEEDSDLVDLLQDDGKPTTTTGTPASPSKLKYSNYYNPKSSSPASSNGCSIIFRIPEVLCFYFTYLLMNNPLLGKLGIVSFIVLLLCVLVNLNMFGSMQEIGVIKYNFTQIHSQYDFDIGKIDHWCVGGGNKCACPDPLHPTPRLHKEWFNAVEGHKQMISRNNKVDVVFLGQTITEALNGRINGNDRSDSPYFGKVKHVFEKSFSGPDAVKTYFEEDSSVKAIAMGLAGDSASNVLWRLMNGELPEGFNPPIWWLVLGMEDIGRYGCSEEITIMGVLRIVEEIKKKRPDAKIVVNSLLPMIKMRMREVEDEEEFVDAERANGKGPKERHHRKRTGADAFVGEVKVDGERMLKEDNEQIINESEKITKATKDGDKKKKRKRDKTRKKYEKAVKKDKFNPVMKDVMKFKKKRNHPEKIPMWAAVHQINTELHNFCKRTKHVTFFDSTSIFAEQRDGGDYVLLTDLISPRGHPTAKGFKAWLAAAKTQAEEWKKKMDHSDGKKLGLELNNYQDYGYSDEDQAGDIDKGRGENSAEANTMDVVEVKTEDAAEVTTDDEAEIKTEDAAEVKSVNVAEVESEIAAKGETEGPNKDSEGKK